jgi:hypothetical protein
MVQLKYAKAISSNVQLQQQAGGQMLQHGLSGKSKACRLMQIFHPSWHMQEILECEFLIKWPAGLKR